MLWLQLFDEAVVKTAVLNPRSHGHFLGWQRTSQLLAIVVMLAGIQTVWVLIAVGGTRFGWDATPIGLCLFFVAVAVWMNGRLRKQREWAEQAVRASEEQYRLLFNSMEEGFCTIEVLFDGRNNPTDYRFLEINDAFERHTGLVNAKGKLMRELAPNHEQRWFDTYGKIALTGESQRFENSAEALGRWYEVHAFRLGDPVARCVGIVFSDVTHRKEREDEMRRAKEQAERASNAKDEFLAALSHELRT